MNDMTHQPTPPALDLSILQAAVEAFITKIVLNALDSQAVTARLMDGESPIGKLINSTIEEQVNGYDFSQHVENAVKGFDFDDSIDSALKDTDLVDKVGNAVDNILRKDIDLADKVQGVVDEMTITVK